VTQQRGDVDRDAPGLDGAEVLGEALEGPLGAEPGAQRAQGHAFDALEGAEDQVAVGGAGGRHAEAAVPDHDARHPVPGGAGDRPVPEHLGVVVGVDVDEARRDGEAPGVEGPARLARELPEGRDPAAPHAEVARPAGGAGPVEEGPTPDQEIEGLGHGRPPNKS
jgi:hypothetical protein